MSRVAADISMSLDGFVTGPGPDLEKGLGTGGEEIQGWVFNSHTSPPDRDFLEIAGANTGAVIMGRRTFDFVDGPNGWNAEVNYSYDHQTPSTPPVFVITHAVPAHTRHTEGFTFATGGIPAAIAAATEVAGDGEVVIMGGADVIDQALAAGLVDELRIHLAPVLMGDGTRLFGQIDERLLLTQAEVIVTPHATHLTYRMR